MQTPRTPIWLVLTNATIPDEFFYGMYPAIALLSPRCNMKKRVESGWGDFTGLIWAILEQHLNF
ncbi:unnamed protein product, partial [Timema podura]|nr:unnamed protein product [Timema podura]